MLNHEAICSKLEKMAQLDHECNGAFVNAPYRVMYDGDVYKGYIECRATAVAKNGSDTYAWNLKVVRPEQVIRTIRINMPEDK